MLSEMILVKSKGAQHWELPAAQSWGPDSPWLHISHESEILYGGRREWKSGERWKDGRALLLVS